MSASSKKKLRKEQEAAKLTEKQLTAQKEAKQTKLYTAAFVVVMVLILVTAVTVGTLQFISNSGIREKNTTALTIGQHELSNAELNYYYIDSINNFYSQNGQYASFFGLDTAAALDEQMFDETSGTTWADYFLENAEYTAQAVYAMNDAANAEGFTLSEEDAANVEAVISNYTLYATLYGYTEVEDYLKAMYGKGATEDGVRKYLEMSMLADSYKTAKQEALTYTDEELRAAEAENFHEFSSFSYNYYYLAATRFQEGGTTDENGTTTYSDEEKAAAVTAAKLAAETVAAAEIASVADLDAAIAALPVNADTAAKSTAYEDYAYSSIDADLAAWLTEEGRETGDVAVIANKAGTEDEEILGYYVAYFQSVSDNAFPMKNVRHILVSFEHDHSESEEHDHESSSYTDAEKAAAKTAAEEILAQWQSGEATEDSFTALATEKTTDTGSADNGGLYENIYPGQMVTAFEDWCYAANRKAGDTGIVETEYGYHVMYFVGNSEETYRDYQIRTQLANEDHTEWYNGLVDAQTVTRGNNKYINKSLVLAGN